MTHRQRIGGQLRELGDACTKLTRAQIERHLTYPTYSQDLGAGQAVGLWHLPGRWSIWCRGDAPRTWWLLPVDDTARAVVTAAKREPAPHQPVIEAVHSGAILTRNTYINTTPERPQP